MLTTLKLNDVKMKGAEWDTLCEGFKNASSLSHLELRSEWGAVEMGSWERDRRRFFQTVDQWGAFQRLNVVWRCAM